MSLTMVIDTGWMAPAPKPCTSRKAISEVIDQEKPARIEPRRKTARPATITGLRP